MTTKSFNNGYYEIQSTDTRKLKWKLRTKTTEITFKSKENDNNFSFKSNAPYPPDFAISNLHSCCC